MNSDEEGLSPLSQLRVLCLGFLQDGDVGVGILLRENHAALKVDVNSDAVVPLSKSDHSLLGYLGI